MFAAGGFYIFIGIACVIFSLIMYNDTTNDRGTTAGAGVFVGTLFGALVTGIMFALAATGHTKVTDADLESGLCSAVYEDIPLISIERENVTSGSFFIGSGSINSNVYYFAYVETKDGMYLNKYPRYKSYIVEYDGDPKAVTTNYTCNRPFHAWLKGVEESPKTYEDIKYQLYVPKGTIIRDFTL